MRKSEVVRYFGSCAKLASAIDISPRAVIQWEDDKVPKLRQPQIREAISDKIKEDMKFYERLLKNK